MRRMLAVAICLFAKPALAQMDMHHDHMAASPSGEKIQQLIDKTRAATDVFSDQSVAIANGYHRAGRDLPMMGEHWLNTRRLIDGNLDVTQPQLLMYLNVNGKPMLTGVVFAIPLVAGESPPDVFGPDVMWHEHNGKVDDEALLAQHHTTASESHATRVAFLHMWTRVPFSEDVFSAENWALPFIRAGIPVPLKFPESAARCMSVLNQGRDYYLDLIGSHADSTAFDLCDKKAGDLAMLVQRERRGLTAAEVHELAATWNRVLAAIEHQSGSEAARKINGGVSAASASTEENRQ